MNTDLSEDILNSCVDNDSLYTIFSYLSVVDQIRIALVCKRWKELSSYMLSKRNGIAIAINKDSNVPNDGESVCKYNRKTHTLRSNDCISSDCRTIVDGSRTLFLVSDHQLNTIFNWCPNITTLSLMYTVFDKNIWDLFRTRCPPLLEHIDFSYSQGLIDEVIRFIVDKCGSTLLHIKLVDSDISESTLKFIIENAVNLELLDVSENVRINGECFQFLKTNIKHLAINDCWNIKINGLLSLMNGFGKHLLEFEVIGEYLRENMFSLICENMKQLKYLEIDCSNIQNRKVLSRISNLIKLEELFLIDIPIIKFDSILILIIKRCNQLRKLSLEGGILTDISLIEIGNYCKQLETLSISSTDNVRNKKITDRCCDSISQLINLTHLDIQKTDIGDGLIKVIKSCPKLSTIEIEGCKKLTNNFAKSCVDIASQRTDLVMNIFARKTRIVQDFEAPNNLNFIFE